MIPHAKSGTLRSCTIPAFTFYGWEGRARIVAYDHTDGRTHFVVTTLHPNYHPSTAFSRGVCRYNGPDATQALRVAQEFTGVHKVPKGFNRYLGRNP